jgi:hypothetical protein
MFIQFPADFSLAQLTSHYKPFLLTLIFSLILHILQPRRIFLSPLAKLPGPFYTRLTSVILIWKEVTSQRRTYIHTLHENYGPIVRIGPNEVSFTSLEAVKEIYQSGGSGYDKTEFYGLFMQFGERTMFSTLAKEGVSFGSHTVVYEF